MASTKFFLDLRGKAKDGKGSVLIRIYHNATTTTVATGIRVLPTEWNGTAVVGVPGAEAINVKLTEQKAALDKKLAFLSLEPLFDSMSASQLKSHLVENTKTKNRLHPVKDMVEEYVNNGQLAQGTCEIYQLALRKVIKFSGESFCMEQMNLKWLRSLDQFMSQTQKPNGRAIYHRALKAVCRYAINSGVPMSNPYDNFTIKYEDTRKRSIELDKLRELYYKETTKENQVYRDYFFLMFFLIGVNIKDLLLAKKTQVVDGRFEYIRYKTKKPYSIKIQPEASVLLEKYKGSGEYLLNAMDHCVHYKSFMREINDGVRSIGDIIEESIPGMDLFSESQTVRKVNPVLSDVTTYYARHTWATFAHQLGISSDIIGLALGHSNANRVTFIYIKPDISKVDEANRQVIDYFLGIS